MQTWDLLILLKCRGNIPICFAACRRYFWNNWLTLCIFLYTMGIIFNLDFQYAKYVYSLHETTYPLFSRKFIPGLSINFYFITKTLYIIVQFKDYRAPIRRIMEVQAPLQRHESTVAHFCATVTNDVALGRSIIPSKLVVGPCHGRTGNFFGWVGKLRGSFGGGRGWISVAATCPRIWSSPLFWILPVLFSYILGCMPTVVGVYLRRSIGQQEAYRKARVKIFFFTSPRPLECSSPQHVCYECPVGVAAFSNVRG